MLTFPHRCTEHALALITALVVFRLVAVPGFPEQDAYCFQTFTIAHNASVDAVWKYHHVHTNVATESILFFFF